MLDLGLRAQGVGLRVWGLGWDLRLRVGLGLSAFQGLWVFVLEDSG